MRAGIVVGMFMLVGWLTPVAAAPDSAAELLARGVELRLHGQHADALELFEKAYSIEPSGKALAQIGFAEIALRRWVDAEDHLAQALARHDSPWIEDPTNRKMLEKFLGDARAQVARVHLRGTPGAEVSIDGRRVGALPLAQPARVAAGRIRIVATAPGHEQLEKEVVAVADGSEVNVDLDLVPLPPAPLPTAPGTTIRKPVAEPMPPAPRPA